MVSARRPKTVLWSHRAPVLDQGSLGSCTGNALAQWLNTDYARTHPRGTGMLMTGKDAVGLYTLATRLDTIPGEYPPEDTGSSGLAVCKAAVQMKLIGRYAHVFSFYALLMALQHSPVICGTLWTEGMFTPRATDGVITPSGSAVGGHEYLLLGCDVDRQLITMLNSWGPEWGRQGRARISFSDFGDLLARDGDATVPVL